MNRFLKLSILVLAISYYTSYHSLVYAACTGGTYKCGKLNTPLYGTCSLNSNKSCTCGELPPANCGTCNNCASSCTTHNASQSCTNVNDSGTCGRPQCGECYLDSNTGTCTWENNTPVPTATNPPGGDGDPSNTPVPTSSIPSNTPKPNATQTPVPPTATPTRTPTPYPPPAMYAPINGPSSMRLDETRNFFVTMTNYLPNTSGVLFYAIRISDDSGNEINNFNYCSPPSGHNWMMVNRAVPIGLPEDVSWGINFYPAEYSLKPGVYRMVINVEDSTGNRCTGNPGGLCGNAAYYKTTCSTNNTNFSKKFSITAPATPTPSCSATPSAPVLNTPYRRVFNSTTDIIDLTWPAVTVPSGQLVGYLVEQSENGGQTWTLLAGSPTVTNGQVRKEATNLSNLKTYTFRIRSFYSCDSTNHLVYSSYVVTNPIPPLLQNLTPTNSPACNTVGNTWFDSIVRTSQSSTADQVVLNWAAASNATQYEVARSADNGQTWTPITNTTATRSMTVSNLDPSAVYKFRIRGKLTCTDGLVKFGAYAYSDLILPVNVSSVDTDGGIKPLTKGTVYGNTAGFGSAFPDICNNVSPGYLFEYSCDAAGTEQRNDINCPVAYPGSICQNGACFYPNGTPTNTPTSTACLAVGSTNITTATRESVSSSVDAVNLAWTVADNATWYEVHQSTDDGNTWGLIYQNQTATQLRINNLSKTLSYRFKVRGLRTCANPAISYGPFSNPTSLLGPIGGATNTPTRTPSPSRTPSPTSGGGNLTNTPTRTPSPTSGGSNPTSTPGGGNPTSTPGGGTTSTPGPTSTPGGVATCPNKNVGDADCKSITTGVPTDLADYEIWRREFLGGCSSAKHTAAACGADDDLFTGAAYNLMDANFNFTGSGKTPEDEAVTLADFEIWRAGYFTYNN